MLIKYPFLKSFIKYLKWCNSFSLVHLVYFKLFMFERHGVTIWKTWWITLGLEFSLCLCFYQVKLVPNGYTIKGEMRILLTNFNRQKDKMMSLGCPCFSLVCCKSTLLELNHFLWRTCWVHHVSLHINLKKFHSIFFYKGHLFLSETQYMCINYDLSCFNCFNCFNLGGVCFFTWF